MLAPIALSENLEFRQQFVRTLAFEELHRSRHRQIGRDRYQQMHMVPINCSGMNHHLVASSDFPDQIPRPKTNVPNQNWISVFGHTYDMILTVPYRMTPRLRRLHRSGCYASRRLKARGLRIPKKGTLNTMRAPNTVHVEVGGDFPHRALSQRIAEIETAMGTGLILPDLTIVLFSFSMRSWAV